MDLLISFALFMAAMICCLLSGVSMALALALGLAAFLLCARRRGFALKDSARMCLRGMQESLVVALVMLLIGCLTSLWRQSGTIAYFTYYGVKLIPPQIFVLAAFLLASLMSYALGTSFGVAGTIGVILMTIARASGVSPTLVGGAIMSGLYFGDRGSPVASSAVLVANETRTEVSRNFKRMMPASILPMALCALLYALLSIFARPDAVDSALLSEFEMEFSLSPWCLLPTALMLALAFAGMPIRRVMLIDIVASFALTMLVQGGAFFDVLRMMFAGYAPRRAALAPVLSGGGVASMLEIVLLLFLSSGCAGVFEGTRMLGSVERAFTSLCRRIGRFPAMAVASVLSCAVFCNQTIGIIMCRQCMAPNYPDSDAGREALMLDIENSVVVIAGLVPWCIACSVPIGMLGCGLGALPFSAYLYLLPLCWHIKLRLRGRAAA